MGWWNVAKGAGKVTAKGGWNFFAKFKYLFYGVFVVIMLIQAGMLVWEQKNIEPGVTYIGNKLLLVTENLGNSSREIIDNGGIFEESEGKVKSGWSASKRLWNIAESLIIIFIWIKVLAYIYVKWVIWDDSKTSVGYFMAMITFLAIQILTATTLQDGSMMQPIDNFKDFGRAIPYIFSPASGLADKFTS